MSRFKVGDIVRVYDAPWIEHRVKAVHPWGYSLEGTIKTYTAKDLVMVSPKDPASPVEPKFKLNDRVKYVGKHDPSYPKMIGKLGVIKGIHPNDNDLTHVMFDGAVATLPCAAENLELCPEPPAQHVPSPIVTETRRYVKSGYYGRVMIDNVTQVSGKLSVGLKGTRLYDAQEIRQVIATLTEVAEVLEENAS